MEAFYYSNHNSQSFDSVTSPGHRLVGQLELPPGSYMLFAKADLGTNAGYGYPPAPWPHGGGVFSLTYGGAFDSAHAALRPEDGVNHETVALMVAAESARTRLARLYFLSAYPLKAIVNAVRLSAIRLDKLTVIEEGEGAGVAGLPAEQSLFANFALSVGKHSKFLEQIGDDQ